MNKHVIALAVAAALGLTGAAYAQMTATDQRPAKAATQNDKVDRDTRQFFEKAAQGGMAEVELGKLASDKSNHAEIQKFAQMMVQDHSKANQELVQLAIKHGVTPPTELEGKHKKAQERLSGLSGDGFDKSYIDQMVKDHKETIDLFEKQTKRCKAADVKQFAEQTLPTLREHLQEAQRIQKSLR